MCGESVIWILEASSGDPWPVEACPQTLWTEAHSYDRFGGRIDKEGMPKVCISGNTSTVQ